MNEQDNRSLFVPGILTRINPDGSQSAVTTRSRPRLETTSITSKQPKANMNNIVSGAVKAGVNAYVNNPNVRAKTNEVISGVVKSFKDSEPSPSSGGVLSNAPNPANTKLDTGIKLNAYEKDYSVAEENNCAPLHTSHVFYTFPASTGKVYDFFQRVLIFDVQTRTQENVNWGIDITNKFNAIKITSALNDLFYALQVYFFVKSIDSYHRGAFNNNEAMYDLRSQFNFDTIYRLDQLARLLSRTALPPNMLEFCRYLHSNYLSGSVPNCPMLKIVPFTPGSTTSYLSNMNSTLEGCIASLSTNENREIYSVMNRSLKHWVLGDATKLYDPPIEPAFDKDFLTIFNNLPFRSNIVATPNVPFAAASNISVKYLSYTNNLDGIALALTDIYDSTNSRYFSGMITVPNASGTSRYSYYVKAGVKGFHPSNVDTFLRLSRSDTYTSDGTTIYSPHRLGSDLVLNISADTIAQVSLNAIDWFLSIDKINNESIRNQSSNYSGNNRRRRS